MEEDKLKFANIQGFGEPDDPLYPARWKFYLSLLSEKERASVTKFLLMDDQKRAMLSVLLQRYVVRDWLSAINDKEFSICRTKEGKPYHKCSSSSSHNSENTYRNFNVSHHGPYVGIVASSRRLVGVDIVDSGTRLNDVHAASQYISVFRDQLHPEETQFILDQPTELCRYTVFFVIWALKESFVKAVGVGLGFPLHQVRFDISFSFSPEHFHNEYTSIQIKEGTDQEINGELLSSASTTTLHLYRLAGTARATIQGHRRDDWTFTFFNLDDRYIAAIAYGPLYDALTSYQTEAWGTIVQHPNPKTAFKIPRFGIGIGAGADPDLDDTGEGTSMNESTSYFGPWMACICNCLARYLCCFSDGGSTSRSNGSSGSHLYGSIPTDDPDSVNLHEASSDNAPAQLGIESFESGAIEFNIQNLLCFEDVEKLNEIN